MSDKLPQRNIYQRLLAIVEEAGALKKTGTATIGGRYSFHQVDEVVDHLRPLFVKHGVVPLPSVLDCTVREIPITRADGSTRVDHLSEVQLAMVYVNVDRPEDKTPAFTAFGEGVDVSDKSTGKATSYALKNHLLAMFHLRGQPDNEAGDVSATGHAQGYKSQPRQGYSSAAPPPPSPERSKKDRAVWLKNKVEAYLSAKGEGRWQAAWAFVGEMGAALREKEVAPRTISDKQIKRLYAINGSAGGSVDRMKELVYGACAIDPAEPGIKDHLGLVPVDLYQGICTLVEAGGVEAME